MERITSSHNPLVQHMRKLQTSARLSRELRRIRGRRLEASGGGTQVVSRGDGRSDERAGALPALPASARLVEVPASLMQSVSSMRTPQGVLFSLRLPQEGALRVQPGMLLLDRIQDPGNLGTILRTADAFDLPVLLTNGCADPFS